MRRTAATGRGRTAACLRHLGAGRAGGLAACSKDGPDDTLEAFLAGWRGGDLSKVGFVGADGGKVSANEVVDPDQGPLRRPGQAAAAC